MQVKILDVLTVPPMAAYRYLILLPVTRGTYYTTFPVRFFFRTLRDTVSFFLELTGSFISLFKWLLLAALIGALTGYVLHRISRGLSLLLGISSAASFKDEVRSERSLADWRQQRKDRKLQKLHSGHREGENDLASGPWASHSLAYEDLSSDF